jgi:hypothetical protein
MGEAAPLGAAFYRRQMPGRGCTRVIYCHRPHCLVAVANLRGRARRSVRISKNVCGRNLVVGMQRVQAGELLFIDFSAQDFISHALINMSIVVRVLGAHERLAGEIWHKFVGFHIKLSFGSFRYQLVGAVYSGCCHK